MARVHTGASPSSSAGETPAAEAAGQQLPIGWIQPIGHGLLTPDQDDYCIQLTWPARFLEDIWKDVDCFL